MDTHSKIMEDIRINSGEGYDVSWECIGGEHYKCKAPYTCQCKCHTLKEKREF